MIEAGKYTAKALSAEFGESAQKRTPFVRVQFEITDAKAPGEYVAWDGYFTEATTARTIDSLKYCGCTFPGNEIDNLEGLGTKDVQLVIKLEEYTDNDGVVKSSPKVEWVNRLGAFGIKAEDKLDDAKKARLRQQIKGALIHANKGAKPANGAKPASRPTVTEANFSAGANEDIPF